LSREQADFSSRAAVYIFIGSIVLGDAWYKYLSGGLIVAVGIGYAALEFVPSIEPPANMR
jgi:hypothetical protein